MMNHRHAIAACALALVATVRPICAQQAPVRVAASVLERYVGEYIYPDGETVQVRLRDGTLFREVPGQRAPYVPISDTLFRLGPVFTAEFIVDRAGGMTQLLSDGSGVEYRLRRKGSPPEPPVTFPAAVRVPRSVLERYVGVYEYIPGQMKRTDLTITIRLAGETLTRDVGYGDEILTPISETRFRAGNTSIVVEFVVDEAGVTQVLGTGFQQMLARLKSRR